MAFAFAKEVNTISIDYKLVCPIQLQTFYIFLIILLAYTKAKLKSNDDKSYSSLTRIWIGMHQTNVFLYNCTKGVVWTYFSQFNYFHRYNKFNEQCLNVWVLCQYLSNMKENIFKSQDLLSLEKLWTMCDNYHSPQSSSKVKDMWYVGTSLLKLQPWQFISTVFKVFYLLIMKILHTIYFYFKSVRHLGHNF
jgi:hypothetical protein